MVLSKILTSCRSSSAITQRNKDFAKELDFKDITFPIKIKNIHKMKKKIILSLLAFLVSTLCVKKCCE